MVPPSAARPSPLPSPPSTTQIAPAGGGLTAPPVPVAPPAPAVPVMPAAPLDPAADIVPPRPPSLMLDVPPPADPHPTTTATTTANATLPTSLIPPRIVTPPAGETFSKESAARRCAPALPLRATRLPTGSARRQRVRGP